MATGSPQSSDQVWVALVGVAAGGAGLLWVGGAAAQYLAGRAHHLDHPLAGLLALATPDDPSGAWHGSVGSVVVYWVVTGVVFLIAAALVVAAWLLVRRFVSAGKGADASPRAVAKVCGRRALMRRHASLRPSLDRPDASDLGIPLGRSANGVECWSSVEDSTVILGPPRSGKGLHLVIPAILDAPGAVVTTSTRPDNLVATIAHRRSRGPVAIFDPQGLAGGLEGAARWSPIRGCESPQVAMSRARALTAGAGDGVENASFWSQQSYTAVRCLLHAAALNDGTALDLLRWSLSALAAEEAADVLRTHPGAAPAWSTALEAILAADPRQRDSVWAMVANAFAALSDPQVLAAVSPAAGESLDPETFLRQSGTLYLLGTATGASASANLVAALIEDIAETARRLAATSPRGRLDPPVSVVLDEAANYPLPSLLSLMSEGGGSGISTLVVLQSLAQARARWGHEEAGAIWDAAIVKVLLGGSANAADLRDLSALLGTREEQTVSHSWGDGRRTTSTTVRDVPVLDPGALRTLPFGRAMLLLRSVPSINLRLRPWTARKDAKLLEETRLAAEKQLCGGGL